MSTYQSTRRLGGFKQQWPRIRKIIIHIFTHLLLIAGAVSSLIPFIWTVSSSLMNVVEMFSFPPKFIPDPVEWKNYGDLFALLPMWRYSFNTIVYSVSYTLGQLVFCSMAGYAFARLKFPGRDVLFWGYLGTMTIPYAVILIPQFLLVHKMGLYNSYAGLILPWLLGSPFGTFLMRQFFLTLPDELEDAALIDGCSHFRIFWQIMLPLCRPALTTLGTLSFVGAWNDLLWPLVVVTSERYKVLSVGLAGLSPSIHHIIPWGMIMASAVVSMAPILILFLVAQREFVRGVQFTGFK